MYLAFREEGKLQIGQIGRQISLLILPIIAQTKSNIWTQMSAVSFTC